MTNSTAYKTTLFAAFVCVAFWGVANPSLAEHKGVPHDDAHVHDHAHGDHDHDHDHDTPEPHLAEPTEAHPALKQTDAIAAALDAGGQAVVVDVLGVVCDFCAKAMNKTFGKRKEVAAVYVDLDDKSLSLVLQEGAALSDADIENLVKRAGYRTSAIRRGAEAMGGAQP